MERNGQLVPHRLNTIYLWLIAPWKNLFLSNVYNTAQIIGLD